MRNILESLENFIFFIFANSSFHIPVDDAYQVNLSTAIASG